MEIKYLLKRTQVWLIGLLLVATINCLAQSNGPNLATDLPKIIPPSPNAAALERFGVNPVDYSTGIPSINYPLFSWQRGKLSFNLGLSYHAGGHKVQDMASNVGLGWALNGIGRISRTIVGLPDDYLGGGFMFTPPLPQVLTYLHQGNYQYTSHFISDQQYYGASYAITQLNSPHSALVQDVVNGAVDGEQDVFSYSFGGYSGRFVFDKNKSPVPLEHTNIKINPLYSAYNQGVPNGHITSFIVTDDKGMTYFFERTETQFTQSYSTSQTITPRTQVDGVTGWLLTKIKDPFANDSILLTYTITPPQAMPQYNTGFSEVMDYELEYPNTGGTISSAMQLANHVGSYTQVNSDEPTIALITFPDGSTVEFEHATGRSDLPNSNAISKMKVKNMYGELTKQFRLSHSYFLSSNALQPSQYNQFNTRLRLDTITELSGNLANQVKPTSFTYNALNLNPRDSKCLDYWGYNINPARNNWTYIPEVKFADNEEGIFPHYGRYLPGSDRKPDPVYVKAALLERITYPTGGYTDFEYECNRAFSPVDYYEDKLQSNTPEWTLTQFGQAQSLLLSGRADSKIELWLSTEEFNPRPNPDPNAPQSCFAESQDAQTVSFEVFSTDATFSTTVTQPYSSFHQGYKTMLELPLNKTYNIKFLYDPNAQCAYQYPFKASATAKYFIPVTDKLCGGVRVKKITANDGSGGTLIKEYEYNNPDGLSSATLAVIPDFGYYRTTVDVTSQTTVPSWCRHLNRTSSPTSTLTFHNGSPLIYTRVREKEVDGSTTERRYDPMVAILGGYPGIYPYTPGQDFPNLSGLLRKTIIKDKYGVLKSEDTIEYTKHMNYLVNDSLHRNFKTGTVATAIGYNAKYYVVDLYFKHTSRVEETSRTTKLYESGLEYSQTTTKTYHTNPYYLYREETTNSKQQTRSVDHIYSFQGTGPTYDYMRQKNMLGYPLQTRRGKGSGSTNVLTTQWTNYNLWNSGVLPLPATIESSTRQNSPETDLTFDLYDEKGNILQYTARDGVVTSFLWGYNKQYPVAKVMGLPHSAISAIVSPTILDNPSNDAALRTNLNNLRGLTGGLVTTYTYKPLVGTTSETDPTGKTIYYEYDGFNRLSLIRDKDNNIVKRFCYKYDGQPVDCNGLNYESKPLSATYTKTCSTGFVSQPVTYVVPAGKYTSTISQADADQQAQADLAANGQVWATQNGVCSPIPACSTSNCTGLDKKCINGVCETGVKVCTSTTGTKGNWVTTYHYEWSDSSVSPDYTENSAGCLFL